MTMTFTAEGLIERYLKGNPLKRTERSALAKQMRSATKAAKAISLAKTEAAKACHDWQPAEPTVGWVAYCYVKYVKKWRVLRDNEIVKAYDREDEARHHAALLADDVNAEWRGKVADPHARA